MTGITKEQQQHLADTGSALGATVASRLTRPKAGAVLKVKGKQPMTAGETVSIRVPPGVKEELMAATGLRFSTVVRHIIMAVLAHYRAERRQHDAKRISEGAKADIQRIASETLQAGVPSDEH